jgi:hypothetical protein
LRKAFTRQIILLSGTAAVLFFLWCSKTPLGISGEWTWDRIPYTNETKLDGFLGLLAAFVVGVLYVGYSWLGHSRLSEKTSALSISGWIVGLMVLSFAWLGTIQEAPPGPYGSSKAIWVLYFPGSSGYFYKARYEIEETSQFLTDYESLMSEGDVLHVGTHPPGLFLLYRSLLEAAEQFPSLRKAILFTVPSQTAETLTLLSQQAKRSGKQVGEVEQATLWWANLFTQFVAVATLIPLYLLLRINFSRLTCWKAIVFWPLIPALAIFLPKSDVLFPFVATTFLWLWLLGWRRNSILIMALASVCLWSGLFLSLAFLPTLLLAVLLVLWDGYKSLPELDGITIWKKLAVAGSCMLFVFVVMNLFLQVRYDLNLWNVWRLNYQNHANFYGQFSRTYWKWLLVNPLELVFAAGFPLMAYVGTAIFKARKLTDETSRHNGPVWMCLVVWGLLLLSGKNMGEAARLWVILLPWLVWMAAFSFTANSTTNSQPLDRSDGQLAVHSKSWLLCLSLQMVICLATVGRVHGFHFGSY